jgi:RNA polymerase sigma-70 factor (ECF subfamily)
MASASRDKSTVELVVSAQQGDHDAFGALVHRYKSAVHGYILARLRDSDWADDLAQETFVAAFIGMHAIRDSERFAAWLFGVAEKICGTWLRRAGRYERVKCSYQAENHAAYPKQAGTKSGSYLPQPERWDDNAGALISLTPSEAVAVALHYGDRLKIRECAEFLGISQKAMESRIYRAQHHLRQGQLAVSETNSEVRGPAESFEGAVLAEIKQLIDVIGGPYKKQPVEAAEERLRVLFARNEDRLCDLIRDASNEKERRAAARMTLALGKPGVLRALALVHSDDHDARRNALAALPLVLDEVHPYLLLEAIHDAAFSEERKIGLLVALLRRPAELKDILAKPQIKKMSEDAALAMEMLVHDGVAAADQLVRAIGESLAHDGRPDLLLLRALVRFGTVAIERTAPWLEGGDEARTIAALMLVEMLGASQDLAWTRALHANWRDISEGELFLLARQTSLATAHPSRVDGSVLEHVAPIVVHLTESDSQPVALAAIKALGALPDAFALPAIEKAAFGSDSRKAEEATTALIGRTSLMRLELLVRILEGGNPGARKTAFRGIQRHACQFEDMQWAYNRAVGECARARAESELEAGQAVVEFIETHRVRILELTWPVLAPNKPFADFQRSMGPWAMAKADKLRMQEADARKRAEKERRRPTESQARAEDYRRTHPEHVARSPLQSYLFHDSLPALVRELGQDRAYTEDEITAAAIRTNSDHCLARRKLIDEWWMTRPAQRYTFTERGRRAWRMERILAGVSDC